ncbi:DNA-binding response regulator [Kibdelosporangium aridum]|uniref:DNA-binding response regulator n=1 Tax=Kibdelosporangium aridum TaxID=2030 RepID=A0A428Z0P1_KIBAR|nr:response regulator transcription factor [Kibdelosporangium aridum]RSM78128.1 DNA-binding response regulator [Kibdelosporangium aridum]
MIRVLLGEHRQLIRGALIALLSLEADVDVVAQPGHGDHVVPTALHTMPDVAVLDIDLPRMGGVAVAQALRERLPKCCTMVLAGQCRPADLLKALTVGVRGVVAFDSPAKDLAHGIRRVMSGERVMEAELVAAAVEIGSNPLSARETDVLRAAETGISTKEIATLLSLSPATVRNYLSTARSKIGGRNRIDTIRIARDAGWL